MRQNCAQACSNIEFKSIIELAFIAGVEPNSARRINFSESYGIHVFENTDDLLHHHHKDIGLVIVCTPSGTHYEVSREVIEAGLNVLIENQSL